MNTLKLQSLNLSFLLTLSIGAITIIETQWHDVQILVGVTIISFIFFFIINIKDIGFLYRTVKHNFKDTLLLTALAFSVFTALFMAQKNGVTPVTYSLIFSVATPMISYIYTKDFLRSAILGILLLIIIALSTPNIYLIVALIGPLAAYFLLKTSRNICIRENLNTNQIMFIRYLLLFFIVVAIAPFQHFNKVNFEAIELFKILVIAFFLNITPLYCSQKIALIKDHNYVAKLASFLPLTIFILEFVFFSHNTDIQELLLSMVLISTMFIFLKK